eukprot:TRINITY_DN44126_c0_g1_i24.p1 TRINITY_DN44126_c0_g1~~TRINITY_DN44126_c0_g1_i24.p1  ORF type:complete len:117 (+),score=13.59 TRINITY_DN44126_c0_g1_i24:238-588(+)
MLHYNKDVHTTHDVVRAAIVPLTEASGLSYAAMVSGGPGVVPDRMVTHTWSNLFRDTMAALVADALVFVWLLDIAAATARQTAAALGDRRDAAQILLDLLFFDFAASDHMRNSCSS